MPEEPEEEPVPRKSSIDSLISHLRNEEVEEIAPTFRRCRRSGSRIWARYSHSELDEKPVEDFVPLLAKHYGVEVIVAKANRGDRVPWRRSFRFVLLCIDPASQRRGSVERRWKDRLARG